jgi:HNH endonuclease
MKRQHAHLSAVALPSAAVIGWAAEGEPLRLAGLAGFLLPGILAGLMLPGVVASVTALPLLLIPDRLRIWYRHDRDRPGIPARLRRAVYAADGHACCWCRSTEGLQVDHVKPWSRGGLTALWNMVTLCGICNKVKSNYWVARDGYVFYRPFQGFGNPEVAAGILAYELRHRWSPLRWVRAGWSLGSLLRNTAFLAIVVLAREERQQRSYLA